MRLVPKTLFGRTLAVFAAGMVLLQLASVAVNLFDRGSAVYRLASRQVASRIAETARILNRLEPSERLAVIEEISGPFLHVVLNQKLFAVPHDYREFDRYERALADLISRSLGRSWNTSVEITALEKKPLSAPDVAALATSNWEKWAGRYFYFLFPETYSLVVQVSLEDGTIATFFARVPQEPLSRLEALVVKLGLTVLAFVVFAAFVARLMTSSLKRLADAAEDLGRDPERGPIPVGGPLEVQRVIGSFNRMQRRIRSYVSERTKLLAAISHDLRTPITRLRLRAELLNDESLKTKIVRDLDEMEAMVTSTLESARTLGDEPSLRQVDLQALVESLVEDWRDMGRTVTLQGRLDGTIRVQPAGIRRSINNLIENAVHYGERAHVVLEDAPGEVRIRVHDDGAGMPEEALERVFEAYYRLENPSHPGGSGAGLGLHIARNIAQWHGGDITLRNARAGGGLVAELRLPRGTVPPAPTPPAVAGRPAAAPAPEGAAQH